MTNYIRFDWAMKRLLRDKANHSVIEGFLTSLFGEKVTIVKFLESESNQDAGDDKFNRVDILAENDKQELIIVEIQNTRELAYFHRMLYGVSKAITDYIGLGDDYDKVRKVYSVNIVYFDLGQGNDYVYHGKTEFIGEHATVCRVLINQVCSTCNGGAFSNGLSPTTTLGCGSWGNNSISENLNYRCFLNITRVAYNNGKAQPSDEEIWG